MGEISLPVLLRLLRDRPQEFQETSGLSGAKTYYWPGEGGCYLKIGDKGTLEREYASDAYFSTYGLTPEPLAYSSGDRDALLIRALPGLCACSPERLQEPERLAAALGRILRSFHDRNFPDCPFTNSVGDMLGRVEKNYRKKSMDEALAAYVREPQPERLIAYIRENSSVLRDDTVLHGDYCLPNILLDDTYRLTGFLDMGAAGRGDRHYDLFWGRWSLWRNLGTDAYGDAFFDSYGRDVIDEQRLKVIGYISCMDE